MPAIWIFDRTGNLKSMLANHLPKACPFFSDEHTDNIVDDMGLYRFSLPADHPDAGIINSRDIVVIRDLDGDNIGFYVREIADDLSPSGKKSKAITAEGVYSDLRGHAIRPLDLQGVAAQSALTEIIGGSGWTAGHVEATDLQNFVIDRTINAVKALKQLRATYGVEIKFTVTFSGGRITSKQVNIYRERGRETGQRFEYARNIKSMLRTEDTADIATALVGVGARDGDEYLDFKQVEWSVANGDPADKPLGQDWIGDADARIEWGVDGRHVTKVFFDGDIEDATELLHKTWAALQVAKKPHYTYEVDIAIIDNLRIGDRVTVINRDFSPAVLVTARAVEIRRSYSDPSKSKVTLGEFRPVITRELSFLQELRESIKDAARDFAGYTWIAYAYDSYGTGISTEAGDRTHMGIAPNRNSPTVDLSDPEVFQWVQHVPSAVGDMYAIVITGGTQAVTYDDQGLNPSPSNETLEPFEYEVYKNGELFPQEGIVEQAWTTPWGSSSHFSGQTDAATFGPPDLVIRDEYDKDRNINRIWLAVDVGIGQNLVDSVNVMVSSAQQIIKSYVYGQVEASDEWEITHNLGFYPSVSVVDSGGNLVKCNVEYVNINKLIVRSEYEITGSAYLS